VYAEEEASDDDDDNDGDTDDYDMDYSFEDKTPSRATHSKKHLDTTSEERHQHSHEKLGHQADPTSGSAGMIYVPFP
jgi:hypothetical protein